MYGLRGETMISINTHEAKAGLSEYLAAVESGEVVQICRRNVPIAQLVPLPKPDPSPRPIGLGPTEDGYDIPAGFFEPLPDDLLRAFNGEAPDPLLDDPGDDTPLPKAAEPPAKYGE